MFKSIVFLFGILILFSASQGAVAKPLDQASVKRLYNDGDFDPAVKLLEDFQKTHSKYTREESLMVYKYLGVMYCADQGTREKGKTYFYKLLKIDPEAKILDMYVSIVVQDIFKGTLDELMGQKGYAAGREDRLTGPGTNPGQEAMPARKETDKDAKPEKIAAGNNHAAYWWIGGLTVAAGVAGGYYLYAQSGSDTPGETDILVKP